MMMIF